MAHDLSMPGLNLKQEDHLSLSIVHGSPGGKIVFDCLRPRGTGLPCEGTFKFDQGKCNK